MIFGEENGRIVHWSSTYAQEYLQIGVDPVAEFVNLDNTSACHGSILSVRTAASASRPICRESVARGFGETNNCDFEYDVRLSKMIGINLIPYWLVNN